jgi:hypothetical protein
MDPPYKPAQTDTLLLYSTFSYSLLKESKVSGMKKSTQPQPTEKKNIQTREEMYCWNPEKMLDALLKTPGKVEKEWPETGLPKLVDKITKSYETFGGMDHLEGKDLPSKKVVIEVLEDLFTVLFPGYLGKG